MTLKATDFPAFFQSVHGYEPFPWQRRLASQVLATGRWPDLLDLPTASGKTAVIDTAVFHLAFEACGREPRRAPMRMLFVIDRRIVVDAAFERACAIVRALRSPKCDVVAAVARSLARLSGDADTPLEVVRLRGGVPQERDWARSPAQPLVVVSTVDQVGSRLLFRGYGVSAGMLPVHAGLVGSDALWLLDEVHLSKPLSDTLTTIRDGHPETGSAPGMLAERTRLAPFGIVSLSATAGEKVTDVFRLNEDDCSHSVLQKRLEASKPTTLGSYEGEGVQAFTAVALRLAGFAKPAEPSSKKTQHKKRSETQKEVQSTTVLRPARRIGVIVNRVDLARRVFTELRARVRDRADVLLLTGRIRPLERARLMVMLKPLMAKAGRQDPEKPIILVATQTVEAGADLDLDALVTEIAPLDALRQRFGRLDRLGERGVSQAVVLYPKGKPTKNDPRAPWSTIDRIYDGSAYETSQWLRELKGTIDFGIRGFAPRIESLSADRLQSLLSPRATAPSLLPAYVELWSRTYPAPAATPEASLFLHGRQTSVDVRLVWRADIDLEDERRVNLSLESCPPSALEALSLPIWAFRSWLRSRTQWALFSDVTESPPEEPRNAANHNPTKTQFAVWDEQEREWRCMSDAGAVAPGELVVLPAKVGGCDEWGWNPESETEVEDLGTQAHYQQRLRGTLRVTRSNLINALKSEDSDEVQALAGEIWKCVELWIHQQGDEATGRDACDAILSCQSLPQIWRAILEEMRNRSVRLDFYNDQEQTEGFILSTRSKMTSGLLTLGSADRSEPGNDSITGLAESSWIGRRVGLASHLQRVETRARDFAERAGLDTPTCGLVALAARLHDVGKVDHRFQADLSGHTALMMANPDWAALLKPTVADELLAKSERNGGRPGLPVPRAVPEYFRHEALSVALAEQNPEIRTLPEDRRDLLFWLIGTHHGYGRPFFPPCIDDQRSMLLEYEGMAAHVGDAPLRLDQGWFERAERLTRRHGPWELARLEAILRLADHRASAEEAQEGIDGLNHRLPEEVRG